MHWSLTNIYFLSKNLSRFFYLNAYYMSIRHKCHSNSVDSKLKSVSPQQNKNLSPTYILKIDEYYYVLHYSKEIKDSFLLSSHLINAIVMKHATSLLS